MDWLSIEEAVDYLSSEFSLKTTEPNIFRAALRGDIFLTVRSPNGVAAKLATIRSYEEAELIAFTDHQNPLGSLVELEEETFLAIYKYYTDESLTPQEKGLISGLGEDYFARFSGVEGNNGYVAEIVSDVCFQAGGLLDIDSGFESNKQFMENCFDHSLGVPHRADTTWFIDKPVISNSMYSDSSLTKCLAIVADTSIPFSFMYPFSDEAKVGLRSSQVKQLASLSKYLNQKKADNETLLVVDVEAELNQVSSSPTHKRDRQDSIKTPWVKEIAQLLKDNGVLPFDEERGTQLEQAFPIIKAAVDDSVLREVTEYTEKTSNDKDEILRIRLKSHGKDATGDKGITRVTLIKRLSDIGNSYQI
ncbi:hypothetical protein Q4583_16810 [Neptunomonas phycophila]|uniref:hypothetical protein n=1 Tax=Neptunomonas phycophila TaxID=1572645 RepID=UPI0026E218F6|nr:hypothetical protein [Neptunomonas phycophila]MDO6785777.1 hypothetical protein [Neptunomonas phycophila]